MHLNYAALILLSNKTLFIKKVPTAKLVISAQHHISPTAADVTFVATNLAPCFWLYI
jgi:hypothetical protein